VQLAGETLVELVLVQVRGLIGRLVLVGELTGVLPPQASEGALDAGALLGEPLACAANVVRRATAGQPDDAAVAIVGFGYLAALIVQLMPLDLAEWIAVSRRPDSRDLALQLGADAAVDSAPDGLTERLVEANLGRQVLALIDSHGKVFRVLTLSSGKPSTPTVLGSFHVYSQTPGFNSHGMLDSNYFVGGYAIHGYADVPPYAASHGCLRIPIPDARFVMRWLRIGDPVDVYR
jgi:threonine dehydrogenase-like Zn-dependent dehydrogenase